MNVLERLAAEEGVLLTESQLAVLEKKKEDDLADGEIETTHPGYLVLRYLLCRPAERNRTLYQQTFVDSCVY